MKRDVPWSAVKQLRTVLETEYSVDDVFDSFIDTFETSQVDDYAAKAESEAVQKTLGLRIRPFSVTEVNTATSLHYREFPFPWYVTLQCLNQP